MIFSKWIDKMNYCPHMFKTVTSHWSAWKTCFVSNTYGKMVHELYSSVTIPKSSTMFHQQFIKRYVIPQFINRSILFILLWIGGTCFIISTSLFVLIAIFSTSSLVLRILKYKDNKCDHMGLVLVLDFQ